MSLTDLIKKGHLRQLATVTAATAATAATVKPDRLPRVATVATVRVAIAQKQSATDPAAETHDPDRWCWPNSKAMTGEEIDRCTALLHEFGRRGVPDAQADCLADKLINRGRELDNRRLCLECI
jgi:hypothetical protein